MVDILTRLAHQINLSESYIKDMQIYTEERIENLGGSHGAIFKEMTQGIQFVDHIYHIYVGNPKMFDEAVDIIKISSKYSSYFDSEKTYTREEALEVILEPFKSINEYFTIKIDEEKVKYGISDFSLARKFGEYIDEFKLLKNQHDSMLESTLINSISTCELFFKDLINYESLTYSRANVNKKTMTLEDIKSFDDISSIEDHLLDLFVKDIIYKRFTEWLRFIINNDSKYNSFYESNKTLIEKVEIGFEIRNAIVHNEGEMNRIIINKLKNNSVSDFKEGDFIILNTEKVVDLLHDIEELSLLFMIEYVNMRSKNKQKEELSELLLFIEQNFSYKYYKEQNFDLANRLYDLLFKYISMFRDKEKAYLIVNYSLLLKAQNDEVKIEEIYAQTEIDINEIEDYEKMGYYAVKGDFTLTAELFKCLIGINCKEGDHTSNIFYLGDILTQPMLADFINSEHYETVIRDTYDLHGQTIDSLKFE